MWGVAQWLSVGRIFPMFITASRASSHYRARALIQALGGNYIRLNQVFEEVNNVGLKPEQDEIDQMRVIGMHWWNYAEDFLPEMLL